MKIFFFGGTFDPPHIGHYMIVKKCLKLCDKFIFFPTNKSPGKVDSPIADSNHRLNMLKILFKNRKVNIDLFEINSKETNYTYYTIGYLKDKYPMSDISMIIGYDQLIKFKEWYKYQDIINQVNIICFNRKINNQKNENKLKIKDIKYFDEFNYNISSTKIREFLLESKGSNLSKILNSNIIKYIKKNKLYESRA